MIIGAEMEAGIERKKGPESRRKGRKSDSKKWDEIQTEYLISMYLVIWRKLNRNKTCQKLIFIVLITDNY